ncbi:MAG: response regulator [Candidatus Manganitrophus sp.]|nr:MAG: response regulator [Candidatus Manganitrophus sp.]
MNKSLRALLVEDSIEDAELLLQELRRGGYDATFERVETADAMTAALEKHRWDVVFGDFTMPRFNGAAALKLLREKGLDIPFIFVSGTLGEDAAIAAMRAGANDYIMKGNTKRLLPVVERELRECALRREGGRPKSGFDKVKSASVNWLRASTRYFSWPMQTEHR